MNYAVLSYKSRYSLTILTFSGLVFVGSSLGALSGKSPVFLVKAFSDVAQQKLNTAFDPLFMEVVANMLAEVRPLSIRNQALRANDVAELIANLFEKIRERGVVLKDCLEHSFVARNKEYGSSMLAQLYSCESSKTQEQALGFLQQEAQKKELYLELRIILEDLWASRSDESYQAYIAWLRSKIPTKGKKIENPNMVHLDDMMKPVPHAVGEMLRLVGLAKKISHIIQSYRTEVQRHPQAHSGEEKFLMKIRKPFLNPLSEPLNYMYLFRKTLCPIAEDSLHAHQVPYACSFLQRFFESSQDEANKFFDIHIKSVNALDQLAIEFTVLGEDLIASLSKETMEAYYQWKQEKN